MEVYKGIPYFQESPYQKLSLGKSYTPSAVTKKEKKYRMRVYNYSRNNAMFVKPANREELDNVTKASRICSKFGHNPGDTLRSLQLEEISTTRENLGHLRSADTFRSIGKRVGTVKASRVRPWSTLEEALTIRDL